VDIDGQPPGNLFCTFLCIYGFIYRFTVYYSILQYITPVSSICGRPNQNIPTVGTTVASVRLELPTTYTKGKGPLDFGQSLEFGQGFPRGS
jgi:hypothetical protein